MKKLAFLILLLLNSDLIAQNWQSAYNFSHFYNIGSTTIYVDSSYVEFFGPSGYAHNPWIKGSIKYSNGVFIPLDSTSHGIYAYAEYQGYKIYSLPLENSVYLGDTFAYLGIKTPNGMEQFAAPINGVVHNFKIFEDTLFALGTFDTIGGIRAHGIAKFDGTNWHDVHHFGENFDIDFYYIYDLERFQNQLYVCGNISFNNDTISDILVFNDSVWKRVGTNDYLRGGFNVVNDLIVYQNELYLCGYFYKADGNVANGVAKWNGINYSEVINTTEPWLNTFRARIIQFIPYDNKLICLGHWEDTWDIYTEMPVWDGQNWCALYQKDTAVYTLFQRMALFGDTLFALSAVDTAIKSFLILRYDLSNMSGNCYDLFPSWLSTNESLSESVSISPNPANGKVFIKTRSIITDVTALSLSGQKTKISYRNLGINVEADVSNLSPGLYILEVQTREGTVLHAKIVKE